MEINKNYSQVIICTNEGTRKAAFASFNRDVIFKNVEMILEKMKVKGYRNGEPIQVLKAEYAAEQGVTDMVDMNGNLIPKEEYKDYWLVADGSHRSCAASLYNDWLTEQGKPTIEIPANEIELQNGESIAQYCGDINGLKVQWPGYAYTNLTSHMMPDEPLLKRYKELNKTPSNPNGMCLSTLNHIFCMTDKLTRPLLMMLSSGKTEIVVKGVTKAIIPAYNILAGNQFLDVCKKVGFKDTEIGKRYLITQFNNIRFSESVELALKVFDCISSEDIKVMTNKNGHLIEQSVINHFQIMIKRVRKSTSQSEQIEKDAA